MTNKAEWHTWFAWHPVYSIEVGWVWLMMVDRKQIPANYERHYKLSFAEQVSEAITGCWHRIPEHTWLL